MGYLDSKGWNLHDAKPVIIYIMLTVATDGQMYNEIKSNVAVDTGFYFTLHIASILDNLTLKSTTKKYNFSFKMLMLNLQDVELNQLKSCVAR